MFSSLFLNCVCPSLSARLLTCSVNSSLAVQNHRELPPATFQLIVILLPPSLHFFYVAFSFSLLLSFASIMTLTALCWFLTSDSPSLHFLTFFFSPFLCRYTLRITLSLRYQVSLVTSKAHYCFRVVIIVRIYPLCNRILKEFELPYFVIELFTLLYFVPLLPPLSST